MDWLLNAYKWVIANPAEAAQWYFAIVGLASLIVKITPTLKDDNILTGIIKFIGKFVALDKYGPSGETRPK